jgi:FixJ family two-component response regulator
MQSERFSVPSDKRQIRVAVVDDDEDIVSVLGEVLKRADYEPDLFCNSNDALLASTSQEYDVIIADLQMPGVTGIDLLTTVKETFPLTQFIVITGYGCVRSAADAMHKGAVSYLTKPLTSTEILAHLEKAMERRILALENQRLIFELSTANQTLENKIQELQHLNELLNRTQHDLVAAERTTAIGEVVVSINHCINNSVSAIKAAVRFIRKDAVLGGEAGEALSKIDDECSEIEAVVARLRSLREAPSAEYVDGVNMIGLEEEETRAGT